jgi:predicted nuclease with TOPRIM domain
MTMPNNKNDLNELYRILGNLEGGQQAILERLESQDAKLSSIETQTKKTNGRVNKLWARVFEINPQPENKDFEQAFSKNLSRVALIMAAITAGIVSIGNVVVNILKELGK